MNKFSDLKNWVKLAKGKSVYTLSEKWECYAIPFFFLRTPISLYIFIRDIGNGKGKIKIGIFPQVTQATDLNRQFYYVKRD